MNRRDSVKTRFDAVEKRYGNTLKGTMPRKPKPKTKIKPILKNKSVGIKAKVAF